LFILESLKQNHMKSIGSLMFLFGAAAVVFGFMDRAPRLLMWIYNWGDGAAWAIKIGLIVVGGALYLLSGRNKQEVAAPDSQEQTNTPS
jgi:hypothetical protein